MIDTTKEVKADFFLKWITVERMREILDNLEPDAELYPNQVGNLSVVYKGEQIGYIDFSTEVFSRRDE